MNREMFEQKKLANRKDGVVPDCYLPGTCMGCQFDEADGGEGEVPSAKLTEAVKNCSTNK